MKRHSLSALIVLVVALVTMACVFNFNFTFHRLSPPIEVTITCQDVDTCPAGVLRAVVSMGRYDEAEKREVETVSMFYSVDNSLVIPQVEDMVKNVSIQPLQGWEVREYNVHWPKEEGDLTVILITVVPSTTEPPGSEFNQNG